MKTLFAKGILKAAVSIKLPMTQGKDAVEQRSSTVQQPLVRLCPHGGAAAQTAEDHRLTTQEVSRQATVQLSTWGQRKEKRKWAGGDGRQMVSVACNSG